MQQQASLEYIPTQSKLLQTTLFIQQRHAQHGYRVPTGITGGRSTVVILWIKFTKQSDSTRASYRRTSRCHPHRQR